MAGNALVGDLRGELRTIPLFRRLEEEGLSVLRKSRRSRRGPSGDGGLPNEVEGEYGGGGGVEGGGTKVEGIESGGAEMEVEGGGQNEVDGIDGSRARVIFWRFGGGLEGSSFSRFFAVLTRLFCAACRISCEDSVPNSTPKVDY